MATTCSNCGNLFDEASGQSVDATLACPKCGSTLKTITATLEPAVAVATTGPVRVRVKSGFAMHHLLSAALFARLSKKIEDTIAPSISEETLSEHRAYITSAVLSAVAALEAAINEFCQDVLDRNNEIVKTFDDSIIGTIEELWDTLEDKPILVKYQTVLLITKRTRFVAGAVLFQNASSLIVLRNALVHYRPEWHDEQHEHKKLHDRLRSRFPLNPFAHPSQAFFPHQCLGYGCAAWAVQTSRSFLEEFYAQVNHPDRFTAYGARLDPQ